MRPADPPLELDDLGLGWLRWLCQQNVFFFVEWQQIALCRCCSGALWKERVAGPWWIHRIHRQLLDVPDSGDLSTWPVLWPVGQAPPLRRTGSWTKDRPGQIDNCPLLEDCRCPMIPDDNDKISEGELVPSAILFHVFPSFSSFLASATADFCMLVPCSAILQVLVERGGKKRQYRLWYRRNILMVFWCFLMALMALQENSSTAIKKTLDQLNDYRIISEDGQSRCGHRAVLRSKVFYTVLLPWLLCVAFYLWYVACIIINHNASLHYLSDSTALQNPWLLRTLGSSA